MPRKVLTPAPPTPAVERGELDSLPEPLRPRENENDRAYAAFLLWCLSEPTERSKRLIGTALQCGDGNVRLWASRFAWDRRLVQVPDAEWHALRGYRALMDLQPGAAKVAALQVAMVRPCSRHFWPWSRRRFKPPWRTPWGLWPWWLNG